MKRHRQMRENLFEYVRGELPAIETSETERHLARCMDCRKECEILKEVLRTMPVVKESPADHQPDEYWNSFVARVEARLDEQRRRPMRVRMFLDELGAYLRPRWKPVLVSAGAVAVLLAAIGIWFVSPREAPPIPGERDATVVQTAHREEINDYFERSRTLLIGIANIPAEDGEKIDLSVERSAARSLVHTARYLEQKPIDSRSRELIRDLERVLIELANLEEQAEVPEVEVIRTGLHQQNLLFKIRMAENQR